MKVATSSLAGLTVFLLAFSLPASAQTETKTQVGGHVGYDTDSEELFFGPNAIMGLPFELGGTALLLNPEFSYYLSDSPQGASSSFWLIAVNALYPLALEFADTYVGAGLVISHWSFSYDSSDFFSKSQIVILDDFSQSSTDLGLNIKAGAGFGSGSIKPFAEVGFILSDSSWLYGQAGARMAI